MRIMNAYICLVYQIRGARGLFLEKKYMFMLRAYNKYFPGYRENVICYRLSKMA